MSDHFSPSERAAVVNYALAQIGKPYVFGTSGPDTFDCSGLAMAAWAQVKLQPPLPHNSFQQSHLASPMFTSMRGGGWNFYRRYLSLGDLVFYYAPVDHVALYAGWRMYRGRNLRHVVQAGDPLQGLQCIPMFAWASPVQYLRIGH